MRRLQRALGHLGRFSHRVGAKRARARCACAGVRRARHRAGRAPAVRLFDLPSCMPEIRGHDARRGQQPQAAGTGPSGAASRNSPSPPSLVSRCGPTTGGRGPQKPLRSRRRRPVRAMCTSLTIRMASGLPKSRRKALRGVCSARPTRVWHPATAFRPAARGAFCSSVSSSRALPRKVPMEANGKASTVAAEGRCRPYGARGDRSRRHASDRRAAARRCPPPLPPASPSARGRTGRLGPWPGGIGPCESAGRWAQRARGALRGAWRRDVQNVICTER